MDSRKLRVGIVTHYWLPHMGGIEVMAQQQARGLADRGWEVTVFTSRLKGDPAFSTEGTIQIRRFRCTNILEKRFGVPVPIMGAGMLKTLVCSARDFDVIIAHGHVYVGSFFALLATRLRTVPLVIIQSSPFVEYSSRLLNKIQSMADQSLGSTVLQGATKVIAISDFTKRFVESIASQANVIRIHPGVDLTRFHLADQPGIATRPLFVTVRRLVPRNGVNVLVRAWLHSGLGRHADLAIVGDGPLRAELTKLAVADPSVRLLGRIPDEELADFYRSADVFVLPTVSGEGYGLSLAEALATGVPAIVTDGGAPSELVEPNLNGLTVPRGDVSSLGATMHLLATNESLRASLAEGARACRPKLDHKRSVERIDLVLRQAIDELVSSDRTTHG